MTRLRKLAFFLIVTLALSACNLPQQTPTPLPSPTLPVFPTPTLPPSPPTMTPTLGPPTPTSPPPSSPTPSVPMVSPTNVGVNCRVGPSTAWEVTGWLLPDQWVEIKGKDEGNKGWWYIENPVASGTYCFVSGNVTKTAGNVSAVPPVTTPQATVTDIKVTMDPETASITCGTFPYTFSVKFSITTNGPTTVTFRRSLSNGNVAPNEDVTFDAASTKEFTDSYRVGDVGDYWFKVETLDPINKVGQGKATMKCTP
jgi:hypothetical protein